MANPGPYPMGGPPMGGPMQPMGPGGPMGPMGPGGPGQMMPRRPVRQGTSRMVPVVVSAGLAIGVFCGLLFGLGTGKRNAIAEPAKVSNGAKSDDFTPETLAQPGNKAPDKKAGSNAGSAAPVAAAGSDAAGSNAGSAEAPKSTKLIVEIKPDAVAQTAKVLVDAKELVGTSADIALDPGTTKKKVKVVVKAPGYKDVEQEIELEGESVTLKLELIKGRSTPQTAATTEPASTAAATPTPPATTPRPPATGNTGAPKNTAPKNTGKATGKGKGSGGLIDI